MSRTGWFPRKGLRTAPEESGGEDPVWPAAGEEWKGKAAVKGQRSPPAKPRAQKSTQERPHRRSRGRPELRATNPLRNLPAGSETECSLRKAPFRLVQHRTSRTSTFFLILILEPR